MSLPTPAPTPATETARPRVVVLGASIAGLLTAAAIVRHADVTLVDRDPIHEDLTGPRRGVPQSRHTHGVLVGGSRVIESLLPGVSAELEQRGGLLGDVVGGSRWVLRDTPLLAFPTTLVGLLCSRTLLESQIRRRVTALPGVCVVSEHDIVGLVTDSRNERVTGVRIAARPDGSRPSGTRELRADLVVDATGRGSRLPRWLADLGYAEPEETRVEASVSYATRFFRTDPSVLEGIDAVIVGTDVQTGRSAAALRQEGSRWSITLSQANGGSPPLDVDGFAQWAATLPTPELATIIGAGEPVGDGATYRFPASRWIHYERLRRRPRGVVAVGDAICSFNPVYGQGMTSAAQQAGRLRELLDARVQGRGGDVVAALDDLAEHAPAALAKVVAAPWALATGPDRRLPGMPRKPLPERLLDRYLDRVMDAATTEPAVTLALMEVLNLLRPAPVLLTPGMVRRVLTAGPNPRRELCESPMTVPATPRSTR